MNAELHVLLLAAGGASRFGSPKQLAELAGRSLLQRAVDQAQTVCPGRVIVVLGANYRELESQARDARVVHNANWRDGLSSSLRAGVQALPRTADAAMVMLCDQPAIATAQYANLLNVWQADTQCAVAAQYAGTLGVPAIFPRRLFSALCALQGDRGARAVLAAEGYSVVPVAMPQAAFDVDAPEDLEQLVSGADDVLPADS